MPFCSNCGKEHSSDAKFCTNCGSPIFLHNSDNQQCLYSEQYYANQQSTLLGQKQVSGMYGLGKAIIGAILSMFALIFTVLFSVTRDNPSSPFLPIFCYSIIAITFSIMSIIFGTKSINSFKYAKNNLANVPAPTLILGIHSLIVGIVGCLYNSLFITSMLFLMLLFI